MGVSEEEIIVCYSCGAPMNIASVPPYSRVVCPDCGTENRVKKKFGPYVLKRRHAIGGMSSVFVANDETLDREVALKILSEEYSKDETRIAAFEQEARLTASFSHPNVVRVLTTGRAFGWFYIAMEFVPGGHFEGKIQKRSKIPESEALPIAIQIAEGLKGAKSAGLIHRDIKPGNILFDSEGNAKIVDFGLALVTKGGKAKASEIWATPYYVPPEAIEGGVEDFRADIYAFGATLYHALAGIPPCSEESMETSVLRAAKMKVVPLRRVASGLTDETCAVIDRAMAYDPIRRFGSYDEMISALKLALKASQNGGAGVDKGNSKAELRTRLRARKKRMTLAVAGGVILVAIGIFTLILSSGEESEAPKPVSKVVAVNTGGDQVEETSSKIADTYLEAREAMETGDFSKAEEVFSGLLENKDVQEPTRTWAGLESVVAAFMDGRTNSANRNAKAVFRHIVSGPENLGVGFSSGVQPVLRKVNSLPFFDRELIEDLGVDGNERYMGYLLAGLKNWEQGGIEESLPFFEKLITDESLENDNVLAWYQDVAARYLKDYELMSSGVFDVVPDTPDECRDTIEELNRVLTLLTTRGRAKFNVRSRQLDLKRLEKSLQNKKIPTIEPKVDILEEVDLLGKSYRFDEISNWVSKLQEDPAGARRQALTDIADSASAFLSEIKSDLEEKPIEIQLDLTDGTTITTLALVGGEQLYGRLESGVDRKLEWKDFSSEQLIELYRELVKSPATQEERMSRHESAIAFEWLAGDRERAVAAAERLSEESPEFETRWEVMSKGLPE